jgi:hypothetical protein
MSKQSSVEWLIEQIDFDANTRCFSQPEWFAIFEKSKAMHRKEIEGAYGHGQNNGYMYANLKAIPISKEDYFNRTFVDEEVL